MFGLFQPALHLPQLGVIVFGVHLILKFGPEIADLSLELVAMSN